MGGPTAGVIREMVKHMYTPEERVTFSKTIKEFVKLYYEMNRQTWNATQWRGVNVLKAVTDLWIYQELIYMIRPDCIIETGSMCGGSALFLSDVMKLCDIDGQVISIDITHEKLSPLVKDAASFLLGSSVDDETVKIVRERLSAFDCQKVMVVLDSDHTKEHVKKELELYAPFVSVGSVLIVEDTYPCVELVTMINEWLLDHPEFQKDYSCEKLMLTFNRDGYLARIDPTQQYDNGLM